MTYAPDVREQQTFRMERIRAVAAGVLETANATFLLLIAQRWFAAGPGEKSLLQTNASLGLLLSPLIVVWISRRGWTAGRGLTWLFVVALTGVLAAAAWPHLPVFLGGSVLAFVCVSATAPLLAGVYSATYRPERRGDLFSRNIVVRILAGVCFAWGAGNLMERDPANFRWVLVAYAAALGVSAACMARLPQVPVETSAGTHPLRAFRHVRTDRVFRWTLISWMFMGFANLVMFPLRVEYLANERYGMHLGAEEIALFTSVVPNAARLVFTRFWGRLFDSMNFFTLRIILNTGFMLGILSFFTGGGTAGLWAGAILFGVSNAGADLAWTLWVTKIAPRPGLVTEYMAVHTFLTGCRGLFAPFAAFYLAAHWGVVPTALASAALILIASLLLLGERRRPPRAPENASDPGAGG